VLNVRLSVYSEHHRFTQYVQHSPSSQGSQGSLRSQNKIHRTLQKPEGSLQRTTIFTYHEPDQSTSPSNFLHFNNIVKSTSVFPHGLLIQICQSNPNMCFSYPSHVLYAQPNSFSFIITRIKYWCTVQI